MALGCAHAVAPMEPLECWPNIAMAFRAKGRNDPYMNFI